MGENSAATYYQYPTYPSMDVVSAELGQPQVAPSAMTMMVASKGQVLPFFMLFWTVSVIKLVFMIYIYWHYLEFWFSGTVWTSSAHIITVVIGSGVLSLAWAIGQLGWVAGPAVMLLFSFVTYYTSALLSDCYCSGDPSTDKHNYTYMDVVQANQSMSQNSQSFA